MSVIAQIGNHVLYLANFDLLCTDMFELSQDTALTAASGRAVLLPVEGFLNKYVEKKKKKNHTTTKSHSPSGGMG